MIDDAKAVLNGVGAARSGSRSSTRSTPSAMSSVQIRSRAEF
jgi:hypothetical protein